MPCVEALSGEPAAASPQNACHRSLQVPVTFIYGEKDWMCKRAGRRVAEALAASRGSLAGSDLQVKITPAAGHFPFMNNPGGDIYHLRPKADEQPLCASTHPFALKTSCGPRAAACLRRKQPPCGASSGAKQYPVLSSTPLAHPGNPQWAVQVPSWSRSQRHAEPTLPLGQGRDWWPQHTAPAPSSNGLWRLPWRQASRGARRLLWPLWSQALDGGSVLDVHFASSLN
jgi:hypothetical protein